MNAEKADRAVPLRPETIGEWDERRKGEAYDS
jgi:hypothetical protein